MASKDQHQANLLYQSQEHPLARETFQSGEDYCLNLIHTKAYAHAAEFAEDRVVLDLGCNNGYGTNMLAKRARRAVGIDISKPAIDAARETYADSICEFRVVDGKRLPFADRTFGMVTSFQVIEHVVDVESYLSEIRRVLEDGGLAIFTTPNRKIRLDPGMKPWNEFHVREYSADEFGAVLDKAFPEVAVQGLFACREIAEVEYGRLARAKDAARRRAKGAEKAKARPASAEPVPATAPVAPEAPAAAARGAAVAAREGGHELAEFMAKYAVGDLFYRDDSLEAALDLKAHCHTKGTSGSA